MSLATPAPGVLADAFGRSAIRNAVLVIAGAAFVGLAAQVAIPLPFTPVPLTGQTFAVLLTAASLGMWRGVASMSLYAAAGLAERGATRTAPRTAGLMVLGNVVIYAIGAIWLAAAIDVSLSKAISLGVTPFLLGDALKVALAAGLFPLAWRAVEKFTAE
jgi:biotin transport system substrate-specific component